MASQPWNYLNAHIRETLRSSFHVLPWIHVFIFSLHKWPSSVRFYFLLVGIDAGRSFSNKTQYVTCHFCENGEFHIMNRRSKFPVQTCYPITHSIAFRSHLTSKWILQTPDESDPAPSFNSIQFSIHVVYLTNGTGAHFGRPIASVSWTAVTSAAQFSSAILWTNSRSPGLRRYVTVLHKVLLNYAFFFITASKRTTGHKVIVCFCAAHADSEEQTWWLDVTAGQPRRGYAVRNMDSAIPLKVIFTFLCFDLKSGSLNLAGL